MSNSALNVRFYKRAIDMEFESQVQGRPIQKMVDYVKIETPGNMLNVIDTLANQDHKDRFPIEWARYCNEQTHGDSDIQGTLLTDWPLLNSAQAAEMKHYKFYTVEQIAEASDTNINQVGMMAGMSGLSLRDKARAFLLRAKDSAASMAQVDEVARRDQENADLRAQLKRQGELLEKLMAEQVKKPGRPRKEMTEA